ncbi:MAG: ABC transporter ATP-binding protein [Candidatus Bathyarchaeota archaeon]|nr:ABC transporter ATP-binding protein [Candidatus Bathyarchaeota archaeon]
MPEIRAEGLRKTYGKVTALNGVDLTIKDGEYLTIVGPSGCGKTTLIKSIAGIIQPDAGDVSINGNRVTPLPIEDRGVGYVFQEIALFPHMNVYDNVSYGLMVRGVSPPERMGPVEEMLHMMNLEGYVSLYPKELSGGARQKTAISRALTSGSTLLLLDEPLGALDLKVRTVLRYELRKLVKDLGLTAIHVTHDQEEALSVSDRIVIMRAGRIVEVGPPMQLYLRPKEIFTAKFLGEANFMTGEVTATRDAGISVNVGGSKLNAATRGEFSPEKGEACVLAIRPEFLDLSPKPRKGNTWTCEIVGASFVGDTIRYDIRAENGVTLLVKTPITGDESSFAAGDKAYVTLPEENLLIYRLPEEGLEKALSLE